jgi:hypothetical protein
MTKTTIQIDVTTRDKLNAIGKRGESYDEIIKRLIKQ